MATCNFDRLVELTGAFDRLINDKALVTTPSGPQPKKSWLLLQEEIQSKIDSINGLFTTPYEVPRFSGNQFTLPSEASSLFVTVNGRALSPSLVSLDQDNVTVTLGVTVDENDQVVARTAFTDIELNGGYPGIADLYAQDGDDITPVIQSLYGKGFNTIVVNGNYTASNATFDSNYNNIKIVGTGKITPNFTRNESGTRDQNSVWTFTGQNQWVAGIKIDINYTGLSGLYFYGASDPFVCNLEIYNGFFSSGMTTFNSGLHFRGCTRPGRTRRIRGVVRPGRGYRRVRENAP